MNKNEVNSAFEILLEEIENVIEGFNQEGEGAFKSQDYDKAKQIIENATRVTTFRQKVKDLQKEWGNISSVTLPRKARKGKGYKRLRKGLRTPDDDFRIPVLQSLVELGGGADLWDVLEKVQETMENKLNKYDKEPLPSNPNQKRWQNTAQWCRNSMVNDGLLSSNSPRGVWEITDEGRKYLNENK